MGRSQDTRRRSRNNITGLRVPASSAIAALGRRTPLQHFAVMTPDELSHAGTRSYGQRSVAEAVRAVAAAFDGLGYHLTEQDPSAGVVRTAPRRMSLALTAGAGFSEQDKMAWWALSSGVSDGVEVRLIPYPHRGAALVNDYVFVAEIMDPLFDELWRAVGMGMSGGGHPRRIRRGSQGR
ncbi:MAG: hypothetical protein AB7P03_04180 [Kofleriaceae bacterium]